MNLYILHKIYKPGTKFKIRYYNDRVYTIEELHNVKYGFPNFCYVTAKEYPLIKYYIDRIIIE